VQAARGGDFDSFRQLYERHHAMAVGIARSRLADVHLAEDAAQEAFATACRKLHALRDGSRFPEWLGTICRRTASRMARAGERSNGRPVERMSVSPPATENTTDAKVQNAVNQLPSATREVVLLHYFSGLSYDEIARTLGTTPQAVHGRLQRARRQLAELLSLTDE
jgi:RNA polymerase sigma-70 factor (ECF subfamily)